MRIGCLQFSPQVADVDNNLTRADLVLAGANPEDLDTLDLLVVPEMAFSGEHLISYSYCFTSRAADSARPDLTWALSEEQC